MSGTGASVGPRRSGWALAALVILTCVPGSPWSGPVAAGLPGIQDPWGAGANWTKMNPAVSPPKASGHSLAYDSQSDRVVLYGGWNNETWTYDYDRDAWTKSRSAQAPPFNHHCAMAYDSGSDRVIYTGSKPYGSWDTMETWAFDVESDSWTNVTSPGPPSARTHHMMAYDPGADRVIMFGGSTLAGGATDETWEYDTDANRWTLLQTTNAPAKRGSGALAHDSGSAATVLFGGGDNYRDTWAFHYANKTWEKRNPPVPGTPLGRIHHAMAYDSRSDRVVMFGGYIIGGGGARDETHVYDLDNDTWVEVAVSPHPTYSQMTSVAYDSQSDRTIQFGGSGWGDNNDTWAFDDPWEAPPFVTSTFPADGASAVALDSDIELRFSTGMSAAPTQGAVAISPAAPGAFSWSGGDTTLILKPDADLQESTRYTLTVSTSARSKGGTPVASPFSFSFTTAARPPPAPKVVSTEPPDGATSVKTSAVIGVTFDQEMDPVSTEAAISISPTAPGAFVWDPAGRTVTLDPTSDLAYATEHEVVVSASARSKAAAALGTPHAITFTTGQAPDTAPPTILHEPPGPVMEGTPVEIVATVTDDRSLSEVRLHYSSGAISSFREIRMVRVSGDRFEATVPGAEVAPESLDYYIEASDAAGNREASPPASPQEVHSVTVTARATPPKRGFDWTPFLVLLLIAAAMIAAIAVGARPRRRSCAQCGSRHSPRSSCVDTGWGGWNGR